MSPFCPEESFVSERSTNHVSCCFISDIDFKNDHFLIRVIRWEHKSLSNNHTTLPRKNNNNKNTPFIHEADLMPSYPTNCPTARTHHSTQLTVSVWRLESHPTELTTNKAGNKQHVTQSHSKTLRQTRPDTNSKTIQSDR